MDVAGRVGIVTGGAAGIGRAIAERLRFEGTTVIVADVVEAQAPFVHVDMSKPEDVRRLFEQLATDPA